MVTRTSRLPISSAFRYLLGNISFIVGITRSPFIPETHIEREHAGYWRPGRSCFSVAVAFRLRLRLRWHGTLPSQANRFGGWLASVFSSPRVKIAFKVQSPYFEW